MINQHVTKEEWQSFFMNKNVDVKLRSRLLAHVSACPECRAFYTHASELSRAARAYSAAAVCQSNESAYAAVASFSAPVSRASAANVFSVDIDAGEDEAVFLADTVEATGTARQFAVNPEQGGACLREDGDAFTLHLTNRRLTIRVEDALCGKVAATLRSFDQADQNLSFSSGEASAVLSLNDLYSLELSFT